MNLLVNLRGSTVREGGDTTISSPGRSSKQPLPGMRRHDPLHGRQACPKFIAFDQGVGQNLSPVVAIFVRFPLKTGTNMLHPLPPPIVERVTCEMCHRRKSCRGEFPDGQHLPLTVVPLPHFRKIGEPTKQRKPSSKVYPGGEAYIDNSQNADEISRLISIGRKNNDGLSILERETRNNMMRSFQVLPRCQLIKI